jgi:competence protein ComEA
MAILRHFLFGLYLLGLSFTALAGTLDINQADAKTLASSLVGVGPNKAQAIIDYRAVHGPFKRVEDLAKVKGIGMKTIEKNRDLIVIVRSEQ